MINKAILLNLVFITAAFCLYAEEVEIIKTNTAVFPVSNESGHRELNKAAEKIKSVTEQTLILLGNYNVLKETDPPSPENYSNYCSDKSIDYIISGNLIKQKKEIIIELSVYSSQVNTVVLSVKETAVSPVRLRDAVRRAVSEVLSELSGEKIDFTSLAFTNMTDEKGDYFIYIDDIFFGKNIDYLELLLSGTRNVKIMQDRAFGKYKAGEINALLLPDDRVSIEFKIPPLLEKEKKYIKRYTGTIDKHINDKYYSQKTAVSFSRLFELLENPEFSTTALGIVDKYTEKHKKWQINMAEWETEKGFTTADKPFSLGLKSMILISSFDINDWDMGGTDPEGNSGTSMGFGFTGSADIFKFLGIQTEVLICNQKTKTLYPSGYPVVNLSEIETTTWFFEVPALIYIRAPENLIKFYGGVSYKYRITPMWLKGKELGTGDSKNDVYDDEYLRMHLPSWLTGFTMEFPFKSSIFSLDFRYNKDFKSWFDSGTPEEDYIADYFACSLGYSAKF